MGDRFANFAAYLGDRLMTDFELRELAPEPAPVGEPTACVADSAPEGEPGYLPPHLDREFQRIVDAHYTEEVTVDDGASSPVEEPTPDYRRALLSLLPIVVDAATLIGGWHQDGTAWSEWDESVYQRITAWNREHHAMYEELRPHRPFQESDKL